MGAEQPGASTSGRWWEYYAVRYAMGVATGALIVRALCSCYPGLSKILGGNEPIDSSAAKALVWAAAGLTYSYIASAPIFTMHVSRMYQRKLNRRSIGLALALVGSASTPFIFGLFKWSYFDQHLGHKCAWSILLSLTAVQTFYCWKISTDANGLYGFYKRLSHKRTSDEESGDLIESYRHLREHGNSMLIVLFEILLAAVFWGVRPQTTESYAEVIIPAIAVLLWIGPSAIAWFAGSIIERRFSEDSSHAPFKRRNFGRGLY